ncbi:MAG: hypothetical protein ABI609_15555 [Acidobacteriota bacterium]
MRVALLLSLSAISAAALVAPSLAQAPLTFADLTGRALQSPAETETEELLATASRAAVGGNSFLAGGITAGLAAGPRARGRSGSASDASMSVEVPLRRARGERKALAEHVGAVAGPLRAAAAALARVELARALVDAWLAQELLDIREQDLVVVESWLSASRRRVEAGADPPFEPTLVAGERDRALVELMVARRQVELTWGELAARADLPAAKQPLSLAGLPARRAAPPPSGAAPDIPPRIAAALAARRDLLMQLAKVEAGGPRSRWAIAGEAAREGEDHYAHLGVAYRFPLRDETAAIAESERAAQLRAERDAVRQRAALQAALAAALTAVSSAPATLADTDIEKAQTALTVRLNEGKERASEILPLRRQLLEARVAILTARAARHAAGAELFFLLGDD